MGARWGIEKQARYSRLAARSNALGLEIDPALAQAVIDRDPEGIALGVHCSVAEGAYLPELVLGAYRALARCQPSEHAACLARLADHAQVLEETATVQRLIDARRMAVAR